MPNSAPDPSSPAPGRARLLIVREGGTTRVLLAIEGIPALVIIVAVLLAYALGHGGIPLVP